MAMLLGDFVPISSNRWLEMMSNLKYLLVYGETIEPSFMYGHGIDKFFWNLAIKQLEKEHSVEV